MNTYEKLQDEACKDGIEVIHYPFETDRIKGLYCDGTIAISTDMKTDAEKACVLAEELGHHYTSYGNILDQSDTSNRKQELRARAWLPKSIRDCRISGSDRGSAGRMFDLLSA